MSVDHRRARGTAPPPGAGQRQPEAPVVPTPRVGLPATGGERRDDGEQAPRRRRGLRVIAGTAVIAAVVTPVAFLVTRPESEAGVGDDVSTSTARVEIRDLVVADKYDGTLGFGTTTTLTAGRAGVITGTQAVGTTIAQGDVLFHLELQPTVLLHGEVPAFRDLKQDVTHGADVTQLEQALVALGYGGGITVDDDFSAATATAVKQWETDLGRTDPDGVVTLGDVIFAPRDLRIDKVSAEVGTQVQAGQDVVSYTTTAKVVTLQLGAAAAAKLEAGTAVQLVLPDDTETSGTISDVATKPETSGSGEGEGSGSGTGSGSGEGEGSGSGTGSGTGPTYPVTIELDDPSLAAAYDSGTVKASVERSRTVDAPAVPVVALVALAEGGYAVQVVDESRPAGYRLVAVEVGTIADNWAEVSGDGIQAGVEVVVPQ